jgi:uroporphyrinogen III methyltransferase / synthase
VLGEPAAIARSLTALGAAGRPADTPVSLTCGGTTVAQHTMVVTLGAAAEAVTEHCKGQAVAVVGRQVEMRDELSWYETKPLFGWSVLVPRTREQSASMTERVAFHGATSQVVPTISVEPPRTPQQMDRAIRGLVTGRYEWVGFTSVNAVRAIREKFLELGLDARAFAGLKIAAVGGVTAQALADWGLQPDLVPSQEQSARGLLEDWPPYDEVLDPINRVFLPRADIATDTLVAGLQEMGWEVDDVTAYRTVRAAPPPAPVREAIKSGAFDAVCFTSSSTVRNLVGIAGKPHPSTVVACIGPATARTAEEHGLRVDVVAPEPDAEVLVDALADFARGAALAAAQAGEPLLRPSQRRPGTRRKVAKARA